MSRRKIQTLSTKKPNNKPNLKLENHPTIKNQNKPKPKHSYPRENKEVAMTTKEIQQSRKHLKK